MSDTGEEALVVVGAGQAGAETAVAVRQAGYRGSITLVGEEDHAPYQRPPLSKSLLSERATFDDVRIRAPRAYESADVRLVAGARVVAVHRARQQVELQDGRRLPYTALALATGGRPRRLPWADDVGAWSLHTLEDAWRVRADLRPGVRLLVVGGGFIGLEAAAAATARGVVVTLVEARSRLLERTCPAAVADFLGGVHRSHGVDVRTGVTVVQAHRTSTGVTVALDDGTTLVVDHVLVGIGQVPNEELARTAGLTVQDGIVVDERARTSDPQIVAAGDCTRQRHGHLGVVVRLESQQNATDQARIAARTICGLPPAPPSVPTFWSDQHEHRLQIAGVASNGDQEVLRGRPEHGSFCVLTVQGDRLTSIHAVNSPRDHAAGRRLLARHGRLDPTAAADAAAPLTGLDPAPTDRSAPRCPQ